MKEPMKTTIEIKHELISKSFIHKSKIKIPNLVNITIIFVTNIALNDVRHPMLLFSIIISIGVWVFFWVFILLIRRFKLGIDLDLFYNLLKIKISFDMYLLVLAFFKLAHVALITHICMQLSSSTPILCLQVIAMELAFTVVSILVTRKHKFDLLQIAISLFLSYTLIPNKYSFLSGLFFFKIVYVFNALG